MKKSIIKGVALLVSLSFLLVAFSSISFASSISPEESRNIPYYPNVLNLGDLISNDHIKYFLFGSRQPNATSTGHIYFPYLVIISAPVTVHSFEVSIHGAGTSNTNFRWKGSINSFDEGLSSFDVSVMTIETDTGNVLDVRTVPAPVLQSNDVFWLINNKIRGETLLCCNPCGNAFSVENNSYGEYYIYSDHINYTSQLAKILSNIIAFQANYAAEEFASRNAIVDGLSGVADMVENNTEVLNSTLASIYSLWTFQFSDFTNNFYGWEVWWADHAQIIEDLLRELIATINVENTVTPPDETSSQRNSLEQEDWLLNDYSPGDFDDAFSFDPSSSPNVMGGLQFVGMQLQNTFTAIPDIVVIFTFSLTLGLVVLILGKKLR